MRVDGFRKRFFQLTVVGALAATPILAGAAQTHAAGFAGHWKASVTERCINSPQNAKVCGFVFSDLKGTGVRGVTFFERVTASVTVAANGHYTGVGSGIFAEAAAGAKTRGCPSAAKFGSVLFNGTCTISETYKGHIANDPRGFPVFHGDTYTVTFNGKYLGSAKDTNSGVPSPAKVGTYGSAWAAHIAGARSVPAGFSFTGVVSH